MRPVRIIGKVIGIIILVALASLVFGYVVMALWNWLIPGIFHGMGVITFWQAIGLLILARILLRGFGGGGGHHWRRHGHSLHGRWGYWNDRWKDMSPEEREKMKAEWKGGWHAWRNRWHDMRPEEREKMKAQWKERCRNWENRHPVDFLAKEDEGKPGPKESPNI